MKVKFILEAANFAFRVEGRFSINERLEAVVDE
jgi:hypothetical protein